MQDFEIRITHEKSQLGTPYLAQTRIPTPDGTDAVEFSAKGSTELGARENLAQEIGEFIASLMAVQGSLTCLSYKVA